MTGKYESLPRYIFSPVEPFPFLIPFLKGPAGPHSGTAPDESRYQGILTLPICRPCRWLIPRPHFGPWNNMHRAISPIAVLDESLKVVSASLAERALQHRALFSYACVQVDRSKVAFMKRLRCFTAPVVESGRKAFLSEALPSRPAPHCPHYQT